MSPELNREFRTGPLAPGNRGPFGAVFTTAKAPITRQRLHLPPDCAGIDLGEGRSAMLSWLPHRRARIERLDAEAEALIRDFGIAAYSEARRREREASSDPIAQDWGLVAAAVAQKTGRQIGPDATTRMPANPVFSPKRGQPAARAEGAPAEELHIATALQQFRIQLVGAAPDRGASILEDIEIRASDVSAAIIAAANLAWPPRTIALRILDGAGNEVFARQRRERSGPGAKPGTTPQRAAAPN